MQYAAPETTADAVNLLAKASGSAHVLAGGSDLLVRMRGGYLEPDLIVDIKRIKALSAIKKSAEGFVIGAAVPCAALSEHAALARAWPGVVEAANLIGSEQIQGRCTMVGNLCNGSPAADSVPALIAAGAEVSIAGPKGSRRLDVAKVVTAPGKLALTKGEIVESIHLPRRAARSADAYLRFIPRTEMDIAVVSAAVNLTIDRQGVVSEARVALGAVAPTALLVAGAGKVLIGTKLDAETVASLESAIAEACVPISDKRGTVEFRTQVACVLARRAALCAYERATGGGSH